MFLLLGFIEDHSGSAPIEYGIIATGISLVIIEVFDRLSPQLILVFLNLFAHLNPFGTIAVD